MVFHWWIMKNQNLFLEKYLKIKSFKSEGTFVEKYLKIIFNNTDYDVFRLKDLRLSSYIFCSEKFKKQCIALKLKGLKFIDLNDVATHINSQ